MQRRIRIPIAVIVGVIILGGVATARPLQRSAGGGETAVTQAGIDALDDFDFWIGRWSLTDDTGRNVGTDVVKRFKNNVAITEKYNPPPGGLPGASVNVLNLSTGEWTQTYSETGTSFLQVTGTFDGTKMVMLGAFDNGGVRTMSRLTFENITRNKFDQKGEQSTDNGQTWTLQYLIHWTRMR